MAFQSAAGVKLNSTVKRKRRVFLLYFDAEVTGMESVYFAACNFKTTDKSGPNLGMLQSINNNFQKCVQEIYSRVYIVSSLKFAKLEFLESFRLKQIQFTFTRRLPTVDPFGLL